MSDLSRRLVVVPMKDPALSKTRLAPALTRDQRDAFARSLFLRTLDLLKDIRCRVGADRFDIAVVTASAAVRRIAGDQGVATIAEDPDQGLNDALLTAARFAARTGYGSLCVLPADLGSPDRRELQSLLVHPAKPHRVIACPSMDLGTNALVVAPPDALSFAFGPRSFVRHMRAADALGLDPKMLPLESLKWDIDSTDDLARLLDADPRIAETWIG